MNSTLDTILPPWVSSPYSLISRWDMEQFSAAQFYDFGSRLGSAKRHIDSGFDEIVPKQQWKKTQGYKTLLKVRAQCKSIDLRLSVMSINKFLKSTGDRVSSKRLGQAITEIENTIHNEMSIVSFFYMPPRQADFYHQEELFGAQVNAKFPTIQYDMVEAGNCFAMGRSTACVFHLMRVMEVGVQEFGKKLGVPLANQKVWQVILNEINKAIGLLPAKAAGTVEMTQVAANLYAVKLAWRNEVMHPNDKYTLEEAKNLIGQVRIFMCQLATII